MVAIHGNAGHCAKCATRHPESPVLHHASPERGGIVRATIGCEVIDAGEHWEECLYTVEDATTGDTLDCNDPGDGYASIHAAREAMIRWLTRPHSYGKATRLNRLGTHDGRCHRPIE